MKKKILSLFLTVAMMLSMATVFAGTISANNVDLSDGIDNYDELEAFIDSLATESYSGVTVKLNANITVNEGWTANDGTSAAVTAPTGDNAKILETSVATTAFAGTFDGQGKTISGLYMDHMAFFPNVNGATIKNVTFDNCAALPKADSSNKVCAGIVVGRLTGGSLALDSVVVKNSKIVNGTTACYVGSLVGLTESTSGKISVNNCKSIACNLYSGASTSVVGGIIGYLSGASGVINITNCSSDTDIVASGGANAGYKLGGILGFNGGTTSVQNCVNTGDIQSQTFAAGIVGDNNGKLEILNCVNRGKMTAIAKGSYDGYAAGILGRGNNGYGTSITGCINDAEISAEVGDTSKKAYAGGLMAYIQNKTDNRLPITIGQSLNCGAVSSSHLAGGLLGYLQYGEFNVTAFVNEGNITAGTNAGGMIGETNKDATYKILISVTNYVNTGDITAINKAGGLIGIFQGQQGKFEKIITVGTIYGESNSGKLNPGASCAMFGQWKQENGENEVEIIDFFYSNGDNKNVFGIWAKQGTLYNNHKVSYTGGKTFDFVPGETNAGKGAEGVNLGNYNQFFVENGYKAAATDFYAENGINIFKAFNLGKDWMLTETVPVPASVFELMEKNTLEKGEVDYIGYQPNVGDELSSIRVIVGLNGIEYENTGFELYWVKPGEQGMMLSKSTTTVYTSLNVYDDEGNLTATPYTHKDYAYLSAITVTFTGADIGDVTTLVIKPYITVSGTPLYGDTCAIVLVKDNGVLSVAGQYVL